MGTLEKAELTASIRHIVRFLKSGIPIYNSEVPDATGRKTRRRRRIQAIAKRFAFHTNPESLPAIPFCCSLKMIPLYMPYQKL